MSRIFISYKRQDKKKVFPIVDEIKKQTGIDCWIDLNGIESGDQFQNVIINAIDNADIVICMLSKNFIAPYKDEKTGKIDYTKQTFPEKEVMYALNQGKRLIPISVDGTRVSDCKWLQFNCSGLDCIDIRDNDQKNKLFRNISQWFGYHEDINPPKPQPNVDKYKFVLLSLALIGCIIAIVILLIQNKKSSETSQHIIIPDTVVISQEVTDSASKQQTVLSSDTKVTNVSIENNLESSQQDSITNDNINDVTPSTRLEDMTPSSVPSTGISNSSLDLGYGKWGGGVKDGKPHGNGSLFFYKGHKFYGILVCNGYRLDGQFTNGTLVIGRLYDRDNKLIKTIMP